ncbi:MAG: DUF4386 domain-containing protein [Pyrinomonadaceae bacterium]
MKLGVNRPTARLAGLIYLIVVLTGIFSLAYVPSTLIAPNDPTRTLQQISASATLYRASLVSSAVCYLAFLFLPLVLYRLLNSVNETAARLMVLLAVVSVPMSMLNLESRYTALSLITDGAQLQSFNSAQATMLLNSFDSGILILHVFWGLWLFPFGWLVYRSGFLPRILGVFLMLGCIGYLVDFVGETMSENYGTSLIADIASKPAAIGEIGTCLWLLIRGINAKAGTPSK